MTRAENIVNMMGSYNSVDIKLPDWKLIWIIFIKSKTPKYILCFWNPGFLICTVLRFSFKVTKNPETSDILQPNITTLQNPENYSCTRKEDDAAILLYKGKCIPGRRNISPTLINSCTLSSVMAQVLVYTNTITEPNTKQNILQRQIIIRTF